MLNNQRMLYEKMCEINNCMENLCESVYRIEQYANQIAKNTKISAWCNQVNAINIYAMRRIAE